MATDGFKNFHFVLRELFENIYFEQFLRKKKLLLFNEKRR